MSAFKGYMEDFLTGHIYPIVKFPEQIIRIDGLTEHIYYRDDGG